jgi:hypothetical protein
MSLPLFARILSGPAVASLLLRTSVFKGNLFSPRNVNEAGTACLLSFLLEFEASNQYAFLQNCLLKPQ